MTEIIRYVADDGKEFEYEDECREYEWKQKIEENEGRFVLLDSCQEKIDLLDSSKYDEAYFIYVPNKSSARALHEIWDDDIVGIYPPGFLSDYDFTPGLWAFDDTCDEWYHLGNRIAELQDMANSCMEVVNGGV